MQEQEELLGDPKLLQDVADTLGELPPVELANACWQRAARLRAKALAKDRMARWGETLITRSCLDAGIPLLMRDQGRSRSPPSPKLPGPASRSSVPEAGFPEVPLPRHTS